jgi:hypothetical protein
MKAKVALFLFGGRVAAMNRKVAHIQYARVKSDGEPCHELKNGASDTYRAQVPAIV